MTVQDTLNGPEIYITENGFSQVGLVDLEDVQRAGYYLDTIQEVGKGTDRSSSSYDNSSASPFPCSIHTCSSRTAQRCCRTVD